MSLSTREKRLVYNIKEQVYLEKKKSNFDKFYIISLLFFLERI